MDLRQLKYAVALADSLGFTRTAERWHVVAPALGHQIHRLEARLFERTGHGVGPTEARELPVSP